MPREVSEPEIRAWCIDHIARTLDRRPVDIDPGARLTRLGLDSATMINLIIAAEEWLDIAIDPESVYEHRTIATLAGYLAGLNAAQQGGG